MIFIALISTVISLCTSLFTGQLVWLISYPNMRVQFQSAWGLANLALVDEDARIKIHKQGRSQSRLHYCVAASNLLVYIL